MMTGSSIRCLVYLACLMVGRWLIAAENPPVPELHVEIGTDRVAYRPGDRVMVDVALVNEGTAAVSATLTVDVGHDLAESASLLHRAVSVPAGERLSIQASWTSPAHELWGCEARAEVRMATGPTLRDRRVFVISEDLAKVSANYGCTHSMAYGQPTEENLNRVFNCYARHAVPIVELFSWAPSGWGPVVPDQETWINAQNLYNESIRAVEGVVEHAHRRGMAALMYVIPELSGPAGYRWALARPEDVRYTTPDGRLPPMAPAELQAWDEANARVGQMDHERLAKLRRWSAGVNTSRDATLDAGIDQYIAAIKRFRFDGLRWDGHPGSFYHPIRDAWSRMGSGGEVRLTPGFDWEGNLLLPDDPDAEDRRIIRRARERLRKAVPGLIEGYNIQAWNAFLLHMHALDYAIGVRPCGVAAHYGKYPPEYQPMVTFAQRYARYFFHPSRLRFAPGENRPGDRVVVASPRPVVFEPFCYYVASARKFTIVVHLWNPPVEEKINVLHCDPPTAVEGVRVRLRQMPGMVHEQGRAYLLSPEWDEWCREVAAGDTAPQIEVTLPAFRYWAVVMLQYPMVPEGVDEPAHPWFLPIQE